MPKVTSDKNEVKFFGNFERRLSQVEDCELLISCLLFFLLMILQTINVILRYLLNSPLPWAYGLTSHYLVMGSFFFALPYTYRVGGHVNIVILLHRVSNGTRWWFSIFDALISLGLFILLAYGGYLITQNAWNESSFMYDILKWPTWTSNIIYPLGIFLSCIRMALKVVALIFKKPYKPTVAAFFLENEVL